MKIRVQLILFALMTSQYIQAQTAEFETATEAVKNMGIGWNLVNTLDSYADPKKDEWFNPEGWWSWETCWGNPVTKPELMKMIRKAGFNTMRIPVTWFPHADTQGNIDPEWMKRVHEVVDYVIDQGMYCILNTHHDTASGKLMAESNNYSENKEWFENVWRQIAEEFKDYDQRLVFEGYNEMTDNTGAFCFPNGDLSEDHAQEVYQAINDYAQSFVSAVRATGGNNIYRNLVVNTYSACVGPAEEEWCRRPYRELKIPEDVTEKHLIFGIHCYWMDTEEDARRIINNVKECFSSRGVPTIISEYGTGMDHLDVALTKQASENGIAPIIWNHDFCDSNYRNYPAFNDTDKVKAALKAFYGDSFEPQLLSIDDYENQYTVTFNEYEAEFGLLGDASIDKYVGLKFELAETPEAGSLEIVVWGDKGAYVQNVVSKSNTITFDKSKIDKHITVVTLRSKHSDKFTATIKDVMLFLNDESYQEKALVWDQHSCDFKYMRKQFVHTVAYDGLWSELYLFNDDVPLKMKNYKGIRIELAEMPKDDNFQIAIVGDNETKSDWIPLEGTSTAILFNPEIFSKEINRVTLQHTQEGKAEAKVIAAYLIRQDGTEEYSDLSPFWGCEITDVIKASDYVSGINSVSADSNQSGTRIYNLSGQRLSKPQKGICIIGGQKAVVK